MLEKKFEEQAPLQLTYRQATSLQQRINFRERNQKKNPDTFAVIIERDYKEIILPNLVHKRFSIIKTQKISNVLEAVSQRIRALDENSKTYSINLISENKRVLPCSMSLEEIYQKYVNEEDGLIYLKYRSVNPF